MEYKTLPNSELELMMILWQAEAPMTRTEIEEKLPKKESFPKGNGENDTVRKTIGRKKRPGQGRASSAGCRFRDRSISGREA